MANYPESTQIKELVEKAQKIVVIQADNPDGDSIGSALALEHILGDLGKDVFLYCGVDIPLHLRHIPGWDRITKELPRAFDLSIVVDTSTDSLLEQLELTNQKMWLKNKPLLIIDHHATGQTITYATLICNHPAVATTEIIYELAQQLAWPLNSEACNNITIGILSDSLGMMSEGTSPRSIHIVAELVEKGVNLAALEAARRETMRRSAELVHYKGRLLERVEYYHENAIATVTIPWEEIEQYSHEYNPSILVLDDIRLTIGTDVAIAFKTYPDGKITAKIRCNFGKAIAAELAEHFGGGGHPYASGFKIQDGRAYSDIKSDCIKKAAELLEMLKTER